MQPDYDIAIIGGGLAGLAVSIQLSRKGYEVVLFEKETYPYHKVCGEYVSLESWDFLLSLGLPLQDLNLPVIDSLLLTAPNGKKLTANLPLGGFGISRYLLDSTLADIAIKAGVHLNQSTKVEEVQFDSNSIFTLHYAGKTTTSRVCCAAYGKRSNLDIKWHREFVSRNNKRLNNYVGIKYHIKTQWKDNLIGLHNFRNGYCGISKIEEDKYCLCYMTSADNLKASGNSIAKLQEEVLFQNPIIKHIFHNCTIEQHFPMTISQISFSQKSKVENSILMLGDAAGMITPLCGNGMSIALHTSKIATILIDAYLRKEISLTDLQQQYTAQWQDAFASRLRTGRILQSFFGSNSLSNILVTTFKTLPFLIKPLIRQTHGKRF